MIILLRQSLALSKQCCRGARWLQEMARQRLVLVQSMYAIPDSTVQYMTALVKPHQASSKSDKFPYYA